MLRLMLPIVLLLLFFPLAQAALQINEIMYDPSPAQCARDVCEWAELWNNGPDLINLSGCYFEGKELEGTLPGEAYLVVARNAEEFTAVFGEVEYLQERSFRLPNGENTVILNGTCIDSAYYDPEMGGKDNNKTLEKNAQGDWRESFFEGGTPGRENSIYHHSRNFADLYINEIFPNPIGKDDAHKGLKGDGEWIELYNWGDSILDIEGLEFRDMAGNKLVISREKILDDNSVLLEPDGYVVVYRDGDADFALNNGGNEEVWLCHADDDCREEEDFIDMVSYSSSTEGRTLSLLGGNWYQTPPSPGELNIYDGECDWGLGIEMPRVILTPEEFNFNLTLTRFLGFEDNITVAGRIETIDGEVVREYRPWTNMLIVNDQKKTYSPNLKEGIYQLSFAMAPLPCPESDISDNALDRLVAINPEYRQFGSSISIKSIGYGRSGSAKWGDQLIAELEVYKGNTTKKVVQAWVEFKGKTASGRSKLRVETAFQRYALSIPVQLHCSIEEKGNAKLIVEGLDARDEKEFSIEGTNTKSCRELVLEDNKKKQELQREQNAKTMISIAEVPASVAPGEPFRLQLTAAGDAAGDESNYAVWSYVYRGNKCYSCRGGERDGNLQRHFPGNGQKTIDFLLQLDDDMDEGEYKLKVLWQKEGQKTAKEHTVPLRVQFPSRTLEQTAGFFAAAGGVAGSGGAAAGSPGAGLSSSALQEVRSGFVAYQSSSEKAKTLIPIFMAIAFGLVSIVLLRKDK